MDASSADDASVSGRIQKGGKSQRVVLVREGVGWDAHTKMKTHSARQTKASMHFTRFGYLPEGPRCSPRQQYNPAFYPPHLEKIPSCSASKVGESADNLK